MAVCVEVVGSALQIVGEFTNACNGYALMTATEYQSVPTLATLFASPEPEQIETAFMAGLSLPLILWLTSWGFGVVLTFVGARHSSVQYIED